MVVRPVPSRARPTAPAAAQRRTEGRVAQLLGPARPDHLDSLASIDASKDAPTGALAHDKRAPRQPPVGREFDGLCPRFE